MLPFWILYEADAPPPPPPTNASVPVEALQPNPGDEILSDAILVVRVMEELKIQGSREGKVERALESTKTLPTLFIKGMLIHPVT